MFICSYFKINQKVFISGKISMYFINIDEVREMEVLLLCLINASFNKYYINVK
jgi:hypothetical protein